MPRRGSASGSANSTSRATCRQAGPTEIPARGLASAARGCPVAGKAGGEDPHPLAALDDHHRRVFSAAHLHAQPAVQRPHLPQVKVRQQLLLGSLSRQKESRPLTRHRRLARTARLYYHPIKEASPAPATDGSVVAQDAPAGRLYYTLIPKNLKPRPQAPSPQNGMSGDTCSSTARPSMPAPM
jgi:hypothetical protein